MVVNRSIRRSVATSPPGHYKFPPPAANCDWEIDRLPVPMTAPKPGERMPAIQTQARSCTIVPHFVGHRFQVHNGKTYNEFTITEDMVGHKLGEFSQ